MAQVLFTACDMAWHSTADSWQLPPPSQELRLLQAISLSLTLTDSQTKLRNLLAHLWQDCTSPS